MTTKTSAPTAAKRAAKTPAKSAAKTLAKPATEAITPAEAEERQRAVTKPAARPAAKPAAKAEGKKDVQKLQRAIVDGLEDVKAQEIVVFDTEELSSLFERVIIASGTSNRQTKALAMSVVDAVREAGFPKPRVEGEANGEWIIVDCGQAVVHVMQPTYRTYYNLEELWGEKPVRLKLGAAKPVVAKVVKAPAAPTQPARAAKPETSLRRSSAAKKGVEDAFPSKAQLKKQEEAKAAAAKKVASKARATKAGGQQDADTVAKPRIKTLVVNAPTKPAAKKSAAKPAARAPAKKTTKR
ncbi:ribosome silencing factor [Rhodoferax sp. U2-2l]|uniref:ribosome silencing factor n=1 Tax=Rhodoferax sp. U2-2l TaxID=2884000 RepID=UPI001D0B9D0C|nr:ribosome silencing factor [Rhodoferax sp. U2-2l]MCB8747661.1 ribosome silencing factor [Rhodoferax sp. U2-2l]